MLMQRGITDSRPVRPLWLAIAASLLLVTFLPQNLSAQSTINNSNRYAYSANLGWLDARADGTKGAVIGEYVCQGYLYAGNVGWINVGSGFPVNNIQYQNNSATDFGVNMDGFGNLRGYAWGANIGWVNFESLGAPKVDLFTGILSGSVYSANTGWISLSNSVAYVQTDTIRPGRDTDGDGIPDAYELLMTGSLTVMNATSDYDGDGVSDLNEYLDGTNPMDPNDFLHITGFSLTSGNTLSSLTWSSVWSRKYKIQSTPFITANPIWADSPLGLIPPDVGTNTSRTVTNSPATQGYFRIRAVRPLYP